MGNLSFQPPRDMACLSGYAGTSPPATRSAPGHPGGAKVRAGGPSGRSPGGGHPRSARGPGAHGDPVTGEGDLVHSRAASSRGGHQHPPGLTRSSACLHPVRARLPHLGSAAPSSLIMSSRTRWSLLPPRPTTRLPHSPPSSTGPPTSPSPGCNPPGPIPWAARSRAHSPISSAGQLHPSTFLLAYRQVPAWPVTTHPTPPSSTKNQIPIVTLTPAYDSCRPSAAAQRADLSSAFTSTRCAPGRGRDGCGCGCTPSQSPRHPHPSTPLSLSLPRSLTLPPML